MKFTIFMAAWLIGLAINTPALEPKTFGFAVVAFLLAAADFIGWGQRLNTK